MLAWKVLTFCTIALALLWQGRPAYALAYLLLLFFFAAPALLAKNGERLQVSRGSRERYLFPGDEAEVVLQVSNPTLFPFAWVSVQDSIPSNLLRGHRPVRPVLSLGPRRTREVRLPLVARERGVYRLGPLRVFVGDFFGISTCQYQSAEAETVVVYPQVRSLPELALPSRLSFGSIKALQRINPDPTRLAGARPYQMGDPLRAIHWPATARTQQLQVKQFDHTVTVNCLLLLNFYQGDYQVGKFFAATERAVTTAASLAAHIIQRGEACGLVANAVLSEYLPDQGGIVHGSGQIQLRPRQGAQQLSELLAVLAGVQPQDHLDFFTLLEGSREYLKGASILLWIVPVDTPKVLAAAGGFLRQGQRVFIFAVEKVLHRELLSRPASSPLQLFAVGPGGELEL
ncbi:MAG: DUF58 domain-containing protein [Limnochordia bacterium]|mgnify:CR=1 FL=1|nr:DUF58 domain-containing protein [Bacillota bacterium]HOB40356.1 DUF58 domain-containing protein [Limnochordia bacterium]HAN93969.1 hypothetical protein [Bacillota bacterium]HOK32266.1 DUF58 domain-containing protein [Limnochordia bacterium]HOL99664.1 DUF58 domain-containing protein [Limnochordia bacterium]